MLRYTFGIFHFFIYDVTPIITCISTNINLLVCL